MIYYEHVPLDQAGSQVFIKMMYFLRKQCTTFVAYDTNSYNIQFFRKRDAREPNSTISCDITYFSPMQFYYPSCGKNYLIIIIIILNHLITFSYQIIKKRLNYKQSSCYLNCYVLIILSSAI